MNIKCYSTLYIIFMGAENTNYLMFVFNYVFQLQKINDGFYYRFILFWVIIDTNFMIFSFNQKSWKNWNCYWNHDCLEKKNTQRVGICVTVICCRAISSWISCFLIRRFHQLMVYARKPNHKNTDFCKQFL